MLISDSCDCSDAYSVAKWGINVDGNNDAQTRNKKLIYINNGSFRSCISKINNIFIYSAEDLDIVIPMYNLLEWSGNYSMTQESLWNYRDETNDDVNKNYAANNIRINKIKTIKIKSF